LTLIQDCLVPFAADRLDFKVRSLPGTISDEASLASRSACISPHGRLPEKPAEFAIELTSAFIPDLESRTCRIHSIDEHPLSRSAKAKLLLELKRTHRRKGTKMMAIELPPAEQENYLR
jgi:hypothetical protein